LIPPSKLPVSCLYLNSGSSKAENRILEVRTPTASTIKLHWAVASVIEPKNCSIFGNKPVGSYVIAELRD
jgi:hypothetical protein